MLVQISFYYARWPYQPKFTYYYCYATHTHTHTHTNVKGMPGRVQSNWKELTVWKLWRGSVFYSKLDYSLASGLRCMKSHVIRSQKHKARREVKESFAERLSQTEITWRTLRRTHTWTGVAINSSNKPEKPLWWDLKTSFQSNKHTVCFNRDKTPATETNNNS